jgi:hypothetical protein
MFLRYLKSLFLDGRDSLQIKHLYSILGQEPVLMKPAKAIILLILNFFRRLSLGLLTRIRVDLWRRYNYRLGCKRKNLVLSLPGLIKGLRRVLSLLLSSHIIVIIIALTSVGIIVIFVILGLISIKPKNLLLLL